MNEEIKNILIDREKKFYEYKDWIYLYGNSFAINVISKIKNKFFIFGEDVYSINAKTNSGAVFQATIHISKDKIYLKTEI